MEKEQADAAQEVILTHAVMLRGFARINFMVTWTALWLEASLAWRWRDFVSLRLLACFALGYFVRVIIKDARQLYATERHVRAVKRVRMPQ